MNNWKHHHVLDLSTFSLEDYNTVLELTTRFKDVHKSSSRKLPALQGRLIANLFFEPSTRTRTSFELAAKRLSADVQNFSLSASSLSKGETPLDTILTYISMGADILVIRHESTNVPAELANYVDINNINTSILNAGDGFHSHPSQGLLDLFTLATFFNPNEPSTHSLLNKKITIVGDILHSRVALSNIYVLNLLGANVKLSCPLSLVPKDIEKLNLSVETDIVKALKWCDAVNVLRVQRERMLKSYFPNDREYSMLFGLDINKLNKIKKDILILHPGPINRGVEITSDIVESNNSIILDQVENGVAIRMAIIYLLASKMNFTINE